MAEWVRVARRDLPELWRRFRLTAPEAYRRQRGDVMFELNLLTVRLLIGLEAAPACDCCAVGHIVGEAGRGYDATLFTSDFWFDDKDPPAGRVDFIKRKAEDMIRQWTRDLQLQIPQDAELPVSLAERSRVIELENETCPTI